ncbi:MAG TPA: phytanoyl-CoA dioxygenase family protein [Kiloniellales bacterium]|nr:phytanoyl-CoA dioxygenase family protein [Kiloniellales bacterium]
MEKLPPADVAFYAEHGYLAPIAVLTPEEATRFRSCLERFEAEHPDRKELLRDKTHLALRWADELIRHPRILDAVEQILGPDILCWSSEFFIKDAQDRKFVSWHQDSTYWGLEPPEVLTAWVALTDSMSANGAMRVIPGSHRIDQVPHRDTFAGDNLLSRGQEVALEMDESRAIALELQPGEMSLHHVRLIHGSEPNPSQRRRVGFAIRYLPTHVRQVVGQRDSAMLVRGIDRFGHFLLEQRPLADLDPEALAYHARMHEESAKIWMRGARQR